MALGPRVLLACGLEVQGNVAGSVVKGRKQSAGRGWFPASFCPKRCAMQWLKLITIAPRGLQLGF